MRGEKGTSRSFVVWFFGVSYVLHILQSKRACVDGQSLSCTAPAAVLRRACRRPARPPRPYIHLMSFYDLCLRQCISQSHTTTATANHYPHGVFTNPYRRVAVIACFLSFTRTLRRRCSPPPSAIPPLVRRPPACISTYPHILTSQAAVRGTCCRCTPPRGHHLRRDVNLTYSSSDAP
ncbi:hypothetical protein BD413DRAFT_528577 [Trametes elegans]|nr:hypothetical protein BD413DRAFT_528577 [Trametes elegans]